MPVRSSFPRLTYGWAKALRFFCDNGIVNIDPRRLVEGLELLVQQTFDDIDQVLPEVQMLVGALDYEGSIARALFEPRDAETFEVARGFLSGERVRVIWHRQSSFATRPDAEAFSVAIALMAVAEEGVLNLVDAIPVFARWRDGTYLRQT
jgi:hypothetical protein